jgi:two-component system cell cycle sensor histidine kinase/response regulator CckA
MRVEDSLASGRLAEMKRERLVRRNGEIFTAEATGLPIVFGGAPAMLVLFDDITDRLAAEEEHASLTQQLRQSQKMEAVGRLAGGVAHDFNNLLTVMSGHAEMALLQLQKDDPLRAEVEEILKTAQRAANLTRQLLAFSRRQVMAPVVLDINDTVQSMNRMLRRIIGEDIELVTSAARDLWRVKADPGQIEQVIANLAVNARDAMRSGGTLSVETANVTLDDEFTRRYPEISTGDYVLLAVTDTGIGMSPEVQARIFEPFFTTKPEGAGSGLGLATVHRIVERHGGRIRVDSVPGRGTTFQVYLPCLDESAETS